MRRSLHHQPPAADGIAIEAAYERMQRDDPDGWAEYLGELAEWEVHTATTDTAAAQEWPEYNQ